MKQLYKYKAGFLLSVAIMVCPASVFAAILPVGYLSYSITSPGSTSQFDIINQTGLNSTALPDATWPVTTPVSFSNLSLEVDFTDGSQITYGSSYFTLSLDGFSFDGGTIAIGGSNPLPTSALLTGNFSPLSIALNDGSTSAILATFSASIPVNGLGLEDGDFAIINATTSGTTVVPVPGALMLMGSGLMGLLPFRRKQRRTTMPMLNSPGPSRKHAFTFSLALLALVPGGLSAATVTLNAATSPSTGVAGVSYVKVNGSGFPAGTILPANVNVTLAKGSCNGSVAGTTTASSVRSIVGSSKQIQFQIPGSLEQDDYYVAVSDSVDGITSANCSKINVTHTNAALSACLPTSSLAVSTGATVTAYVPNGWWGGASTGIQAVPVEGGGLPASIATPGIVNSCSANPATGKAVCTANTTDVYIISGTTLTNVLTSGSNTYAGFSGGSCLNCGVAINALTNKAVIAMGLSGSPSNSGLQVLDLNTNTFAAPVPSNHIISEDISIDPTRGLILSPGESNNYTLFKISTSGTLTEFGNQISTGGEFDSAAEDCTTGIALSAVEFTGDLFLTDLTQATFTPGSPGTWTAPSQVQSFPEFASFSAGTSGISVAPGSSHLGIVSGEFGGSSFGVIQLPATSGSGTPSVLDYAAASLPNTPDGNYFSAGYDPHTLTAYTSPNNGRAYGIIADWAIGSPSYLAIIDLAKLLAAPRSPGTHHVDPAYDLLANGVVRYVATH